MVSERDRIFQERLRKYQTEQNRLDAENRKLAWQWQEYVKLSQNTRERGARYDHGRWSRGWQQGCGHRKSYCHYKIVNGKKVSTRPETHPIYKPHEKHPNRRVQERLDRQRDIGKEIDKIKAQREKAITEENTRKLRMLEGQFKQERTNIKKFFKQRRQQIHPETGTISSPRRRHPSGARARYVPPKRRSRPRPRPRPRR